MSNGLGAGFALLSILAVLAGLALLGGVLTVVSVVFVRRRGGYPAALDYPLLGVGASVLGVAGFGTLALADEAAAAAGLLAALALGPPLVVGVFLRRTTTLSGRAVATTTVMAWGPSFLVGLAVAVGTMLGLTSALGLAPAQAREAGIAWLASGAGALAAALGGVVLGPRFGRLSLPPTAAPDDK